MQTSSKRNDIISDNGKIAEAFNDFFTTVVKNLNITVIEDILCKANNIKDPVLRCIEKYKKNLSIKGIAGISKNDNFILEKVSYEKNSALNKTVRNKKGISGH